MKQVLKFMRFEWFITVSQITVFNSFQLGIEFTADAFYLVNFSSLALFFHSVLSVYHLFFTRLFFAA